MNPTGEQPAAAAVGLQPPRSSFSSSCERHPEEKFSGFCPSCLCERLTTLDQSASAVASSSSRRNSTSSSNAAAAIKALFRAPSDLPNKNNNKTTTTRTSFFPELRRTKSFSASKNEGLAGVWEPQRKSCDVRGRNTLCSLFSIHDENKPTLGNNATLLETNKEDDEEIHNDDDDEEEIRVTEEIDVNGLENNIVAKEAEIEEQVDATVDDLKTMKDHIDLNSQAKKPSLSNFWSAASVLSKKWHKWRRNQKKSGVGCNGAVLSSTLPVEKQTSRETQSEIADYGFGRRSCDIDPRFSLDAGRISFDDPRYSFDEPRASWDGYLIGRTFPRLPPMVEDVAVVHVPRCDTQIPVEETSMAEDNIPGGSIQTREYYLDSSSKSRRKSLDRSNSIRRMAASVVAEMDEKVSNAKVSPATIDYNPVHGGSTDKEAARISTSNSLRDDCSETFELGFRDNGTAIGAGKKDTKKPRRWRWKLWGFIQRRSGNKDDDEDRCSSVNGVGRSYSESWQDLRREGNNNRKVFRSNSSVSWRKSNGNGNKIMRRGGEEFVLERNRSARYSPNHVDNGLLRFYLAPLSASASASRRGTRPTNNSRSILGLY